MLEPDANAAQDREKGPSRIVVVLGALSVTAVTLTLALYLGAFGFHVRRYGTHEARLARLARLEPTLDQVLQAFTDEGTLLVDSPSGPEALGAAASRWRDQKRPEILEKGARWPTTRVFVAGDMVYFVYFDGGGVLRDFTCVSR